MCEPGCSVSSNDTLFTVDVYVSAHNKMLPFVSMCITQASFLPLYIIIICYMATSVSTYFTCLHCPQ